MTSDPSAQAAIAFDFGLSRIGVAYGQRLTHSATALGTLAAKQGRPNWHQLGSLVDEWQPDILVVGQPGFGSLQTSIHSELNEFVDQLKERFKQPIVLVDETLTSREAQARLTEQRQSGVRKRKIKKEQIDSLSAQLIVEAWLKLEI